MNEKSRHEEVREQCAKFHNEHPRVWVLFVKFTRNRIRRGFKNYSVSAIFERVRWETDQADTKGGVIFKINNNYKPFYARRFMKVYPEHDGFFRTRAQITKRRPATGRRELSPRDFD